MEPHKFDAHIKQQLEERTIEPGEKAWDKIVASIETKPKRSFKTWYWMAASIVILVVITAVFFTKEELPVEIVEEEIVIPKVEKPSSSDIDELPIQEKVVIAKEETPVIPNTNKQEVVPVQENDLIEEEVAQALPLAMVDTMPDTIDFEQQKIAELVEKIKDLKQQGAVTDAEIDALLLQAQKEIQVQRAYGQNTRVDAMALLLDAEAELEKPFKERVFELLKEGFEKAKTVVAERD